MTLNTQGTHCATYIACFVLDGHSGHHLLKAVRSYPGPLSLRTYRRDLQYF